MTENQENPQITGEQIRALRRMQGMTHLAFARKLDIPVWMMEILEQEEIDGSDQLSQIIPETMRDRFFHLLLQEYGQPETWFEVAPSSHSQKPREEGMELTLNLPITVSPQMAMEWMDVILLLFSDDMSYADLKKRCAGYLVSNLMQLHQLYCNVWRAEGNDHIAQENSKMLKTRISQKIRELEAV